MGRIRCIKVLAIHTSDRQPVLLIATDLRAVFYLKDHTENHIGHLVNDPQRALCKSKPQQKATESMTY